MMTQLGLKQGKIAQPIQGYLIKYNRGPTFRRVFCGKVLMHFGAVLVLKQRALLSDQNT